MKHNKIILAAVLIIWGILTRTIWHIGPNIEFVTAAAIISGLLFDGAWAFLVPLMIMLPSDLILGNTNIFLFTWSGFLIPVLFGKLLAKLKAKWQERKFLKLAIGSEIAGISGTLFFYIWTNFGHWLTTNMYAKDLGGLLQSYINALPFLRPQLFANLIIVPVFAVCAVMALELATAKLGKIQYK